MTRRSARALARPSDPLLAAQRHQAEGRPAKAEAGFRTVLAAEPDQPQALFGLGLALGALGRLDEAIDCFARLVARLPRDFAANYNLAYMLQRVGRMAEAADAYATAATIQPWQPEVHNNLGLALIELGRLAEAHAVFLKALQLAPKEALIWFNLANVDRELGRYAAALAAYDHALRLRPGFAQALNNRGLTLLKLGRPQEALAAFEATLAAAADHPGARTNRGVALYERGDIDGAIAAHRDALAQSPDDPEANANLALALLAQGRWAEAAPHYAHRWDLPAARRYRRDAPPLWDGTPLDGTLLVTSEQGLGDVIQFVRLCAAARRRVGRLLLTLPRRLMRLLKDVPGVDQVVDEDQPTAADRRIPLLDLPFLLGVEADGILQPPYLAAEPALIAEWAARLGPGRKIGVAWQGAGADSRSLPLAALAPLQRDGVRLIALIDAPSADGDPPVERLALDRTDAFVDTAAVMASLDLVITCDTSIAHLAGAMGVPAWVALKAQPDWRWCAEPDRSPWYPSLRLYRQNSPGDWPSAVARMAQDLDVLLG